jgi:hypothetical protein
MDGRYVIRSFLLFFLVLAFFLLLLNLFDEFILVEAVLVGDLRPGNLGGTPEEHRKCVLTADPALLFLVCVDDPSPTARHHALMPE